MTANQRVRSKRAVPERFAVVAAASVVATLLTFGGLRSDTLRHDQGVTVIYVGADDCGPCHAWQRGMGTDFRASAEFARLTYREVKASTLFVVLDDDVWPSDLRNYRTSIKPSDGVPLWLVVADGQVVAQGFGASQWQQTVLPTLKVLMH
jgi:hypothetical protein